MNKGPRDQEEKESVENNIPNSKYLKSSDLRKFIQTQI